MLISDAVGMAGMFRDLKKNCEHSRYIFDTLDKAGIYFWCLCIQQVYFWCCIYSRYIFGAVDTTGIFFLGCRVFDAASCQRQRQSQYVRSKLSTDKTFSVSATAAYCFPLSTNRHVKDMARYSRQNCLRQDEDSYEMTRLITR